MENPVTIKRHLRSFNCVRLAKVILRQALHLVRHGLAGPRLSAENTTLLEISRSNPSSARQRKGNSGRSRVFRSFQLLSRIFEFSVVACFLAIFLHFGTSGTAAQYRRHPCNTEMEPARWERSSHANEAMGLQDIKPSSLSS